MGTGSLNQSAGAGLDEAQGELLDMAEQLLLAGSYHVSTLPQQRVLEPCFEPPKPPSPPLTRLPHELLADIVNRLENSEIKNLRLSCKRLASISTLRINRVFLSANPLNVKVFRAIADHEVFRHGVIEIIYDDARLPRSAYEDSSTRRPELLLHDSSQDLGVQTNENWFENERQKNIKEIYRHNVHTEGQWGSLARVKQAANEMSRQASWTYYQDLVHQQDKVIASGADIEALRYGLRRFPSLQTVTITPAAHGLSFSPLYKTPMIRAFPFGFNYPLPRGWPARRERQPSLAAAPWVNEENSVWAERVRAKWRGCQIVARVLAQERGHHRVSGLLIDSNQLLTGLSCRLFEQPCEEYTDIASILGHPGLRRLHLSLHIDAQQCYDWPAFRSGLLRDALAKSVDLEQFTLAADTDPDDVDEGQPPPSLETFLPIDCWPRLRHLRLWNWYVEKDKLLLFLAQLPQTLCSLELSLLSFSDGGNYHSLLSDIRGTLGWKERQIRPSVKIAIPRRPYYRDGQAIWLEKEVNEFLYGHADNPFDTRLGSNRVLQGVGIVRDAFIADYEKPW